jgi:hypothetical protein
VTVKQHFLLDRNVDERGLILGARVSFFFEQFSKVIFECHPFVVCGLWFCSWRVKVVSKLIIFLNAVEAFNRACHVAPCIAIASMIDRSPLTTRYAVTHVETRSPKPTVLLRMSTNVRLVFPESTWK